MTPLIAILAFVTGFAVAFFIVAAVQVLRDRDF